MRYYIYVSETKVEQLFAQIPTKLRDKIAARFTIDLKLVKAEFGGRQPRESLISKLEIVRAYLDDQGLIGTTDNPKSFFGDVLPLNWGPYAPDFDEEIQFVYFGGRTEETIVGLGGSLKHVLGEAGETTSHSHSLTPYLIQDLQKLIEASKVNAEMDGNDALSAVHSVAVASGEMGGPWERMEFVAKRLASGIVNDVWWNPRHHNPFGGHDYEQIGRIKAMLGTPLYVAMAD